MSSLEEALERARSGGPQRHHQKSQEQGKLPVRERVERLVDPGSFVEDAVLANWEQDGFGADGVVTGMAAIGGRAVALMANDPTARGRRGRPAGRAAQRARSPLRRLRVAGALLATQAQPDHAGLAPFGRG